MDSVNFVALEFILNSTPLLDFLLPFGLSDYPLLFEQVDQESQHRVEEVDFLGPSKESQCKEWADALRKNTHKLRLINRVNKETGHKYAFLVLQGADIKRMFSSEHYKHDAIDFEPSWESATELDSEWKEEVLSFIDFLESCGGIIRVA